MKIHHGRNATMVIESGPHSILIDPMLGAKGILPPVARFRYTPAPIPPVELPANAWEVLAKVTDCLIRPCQPFGIKALLHTYHLEALTRYPTTRALRHQTLDQEGLLSKTSIPDDGEPLCFEQV